VEVLCRAARAGRRADGRANGSDTASGVWQALTVPLGQTVTGLRVTCRPLQGAQLPLVRAISPEYGEAQKTHFHLAQFKPYQLGPLCPRPSGRRTQTADGEIPDQNFLAGKASAGCGRMPPSIWIWERCATSPPWKYTVRAAEAEP